MLMSEVLAAHEDSHDETGEAIAVDAATATRPEQGDAAVSPQDPDPVLAALADLKESFDSKIRYDEAKERQITVLHQELESHRQSLYQQILRPVLTDLVGIYDEVANQSGVEPQTVARESLLETIEVVLERYGVTTYTCEGDGVDRVRQRVIDVDRTSDPGLNRRLARRLRTGFEVSGKVLRPEWVVAYRYVPDKDLDS
jgi:molecular chaperone GrpE (heat shock protein)